MKNSYLVITLVTVLFVDGWWTGLLKWLLVGTVSSKIIGAAFNTLVDICAYHPDIWESSAYLLSLPRNSELKFDCPPGFIPAANQSHFPTSNGCGAEGLKIESKYLPHNDQEDCCNAHDVCYDKCHAISTIAISLHRIGCDQKFKDCLTKICALKSWQLYFLCPFQILLTTKFWKENCEEPSRYDNEKKCKASAKVLYESVNRWGHDAYVKAQSIACVCIPV
ncbi:group XIIB secretory phospholipase A2-like protein [Daphnia carinata]|uniref:group XIIB secretory phospholipase A2-like protein n=1 Tax=Daphnia carinata TaxID=120202 RepID=UPI00257FC7E3|nr:group XIIB secretory phospholipase A2-like protein [Daphnia carinata]